jgi:hypothetical protein
MRPRSFETRRRRPSTVALAAAAVAGLAVIVAIEWPAAPAQQASPMGGDPSQLVPNPWLAAARGDDLSRGSSRNGDFASIDPFASGAAAADAKPVVEPARLRLSAPKSLAVGDMDDVVVSVDAPSQVSWLSFKVSMNADVLQAQSVGQGDWTADPRAGFDLDIAPNADSVVVEAVAGYTAAGGRAGSVARIRVQAMATGATEVRLTDIVAKDDQGRPLAIVPIDPVANVSAMTSLPVATADAARSRSARPVGDMSASD